MTGFPRFSMRSNTCCPASAWSRPDAGVCTASSLMSAPATNDLSPAPVRITARTSSSRFKSRATRRSSSRVRALRALRTLGRLIVTSATAPSRSRSRLSTVMTGTSLYSSLEGKRGPSPAEYIRGDEEAGEEHAAESKLRPRVVFTEERKHQRHEQREDGAKHDMALH